MSAGDSDAGAGRKWLRVRNGRGEEVSLIDAITLYAWSSKGVLAATRDALNELREVGAKCVALHSGTADLVANLELAARVMRTELIDVRVWAGVGIDGMLDAWHAGKLTTQQVAARHIEVAKACDRAGIEVIVLNGEGKWALNKSTRSRADVAALADAIGHAYREHAPRAVLGLSSFGALGYHADVRAMIEGLTPHCSLFTGQSYAARPGPVAPGVLPGVIKRDERSQEAAERQGWMRDDTSEGGEDVSPDDLDRVPTVQAHKTHPIDLVRLLVARPHVLVWSVPTIGEGGRADAVGLEAIRVAQVLRGWTSVQAFQRARGLVADGVIGPRTYEAAAREKLW